MDISLQTNPPSDSAHPVDAGSSPTDTNPNPQAVSTRIVGKFVIETGIPMPDFPGRVGRSGKYPFGEMAVGESVEIRGVKQATLDGAISSWRKRNNIDLARVRVAGSEPDVFRVFRRG